MKPISIYLISYYFLDVIFGVIDRIHEVTNYPVKIIVGDNYSQNSSQIRQKLNQYRSQNKIHAAYLYPNNHGTKIIKHMVFTENEKSDFIIVGDGDALISPSVDHNWINHFLSILKDPKVGLIGFQSKNESLPIAMSNGKRDSANFKINPVSLHTLFSPEKVLTMGASPIRGHFMTLRTNDLYEYYEHSALDHGTYDGQLQRFLASRGYSIAKYTKSFTYNLGTIKSGFDCDNLSSIYKPDISYQKIRKIKWAELDYPTKYKKI